MILNSAHENVELVIVQEEQVEPVLRLNLLIDLESRHPLVTRYNWDHMYVSHELRCHMRDTWDLVKQGLVDLLQMLNVGQTKLLSHLAWHLAWLTLSLPQP